jgi:D-arginine dehydrogenase
VPGRGGEKTPAVGSVTGTAYIAWAMVENCDFLIVGGGIAGASAAFALAQAAPTARIVLVEREDAPGFHTTGRSVAMFLETYEGPLVRALTRASRRFLFEPPAGFSPVPLVQSRAVLHLARDEQRQRAETLYAACRDATQGLRLLDATEARTLQPALRPGFAACAILEPGAADIDVDALLQGYLRGFRGAGGHLVTGAQVRRLERRAGRWHAETSAGEFAASTVINAAGAWADAIAALAGIPPLGLTPKRRTVITFDPPGHCNVRGWPFTVDVDEQFYFKPDAGRILVSPCDETPSPPCDAQPEEWDAAVAVDRIEAATTLPVGTIAHKWAGLRSFFADRLPAVGPDPLDPGFFWLAGQGGFGILTSPALGRAAAALACGEPLPEGIAGAGVTAAALAPDRLRSPTGEAPASP